MIGTLGVLVLHARKISNYLKENIQLVGDDYCRMQKTKDINKLKEMLEKSEKLKSLQLYYYKMRLQNN